MVLFHPIPPHEWMSRNAFFGYFNSLAKGCQRVLLLLAKEDAFLDSRGKNLSGSKKGRC
jgi:hypothetical protein